VHHYFDALDLDAYLRETKKKRQQYIENIRKKAFRKTDLFYQRGQYQYRFKISRHATTKRSSTNKTRLTLPEGVVGDVLKYLVIDETSSVKLSEYLKDVKDEKQIALIFYNRERTHLIGLLAAFDVRLEDAMVITVVTMYDDVPTDKSAQKLLFPKVERITLFEYDLESCMHQYELREAEKRRVKEEQLEQALKEVKKETSIIKVSSLDNYSGEKRYIKKAKVTSRANRKIRKVKVEKPQYPTREEVSPQPVKNVSMVKRLFKNFVLWLQNIYMKLK
jgi:hypothetical protein